MLQQTNWTKQVSELSAKPAESRTLLSRMTIDSQHVFELYQIDYPRRMVTKYEVTEFIDGQAHTLSFEQLELALKYLFHKGGI